MAEPLSAEFREALKAVSSEFDSEVARLVGCRAIGMLTRQEYLIDKWIAGANCAVSIIRQAELHCGLTHDESLAKSEALAIAIRAMLPSGISNKAYLRDRTTFDAVFEVYCQEHGVSGVEARRVVPRELRKRRSGERPTTVYLGGRLHTFEGADRISYPTDISEIIAFIATRPGFGSPKSVERQYLNFRKAVMSALFRDPETGRIYRDSAYRRVVYLRLLLAGDAAPKN